MMTGQPFLFVDQLEVTIRTRKATDVLPVRDASFSLFSGETLALVGESGCGKSMTCLALSGLLPRRARISAGDAQIDGRSIVGLNAGEMRALRRQKIAFVFQDATNGLNPVKTVGWQIAEAVMLREGVSRTMARRRAIDLLQLVGMPNPTKSASDFPHQLSGGMNQRVMIALAVAGGPKLLIADEATTALDVTIQAQILDLLSSLRRDFGMSVIFVTHDLGLVAEMADRVAVMYAGRVVEVDSVEGLFRAPRHPYTEGLLRSLPRVDRRREALSIIEGQVPPIDAMPAGCAFAPRCAHATGICRSTVPALVDAGGNLTACHHPRLGRAA